MPKTIKQILIIFCTLLLILCVIAPTAKAFSLEDIMNSGKTFVGTGAKDDLISQDELQGILIPIGKMLIRIAMAVLVIVTIIMGCKYMLSTADPEAQAKLKKQLIGLAVSIIVIAGAQGIWALLYGMFEQSL